MQPHDPDFMAVGDLSTVTVLPWQPGYARIVCVGHVLERPYPFDTRWILMQQLERLRAKAVAALPGWSPSSCCCANRGGTDRAGRRQRQLDKPCYDYKGLSRSRQVLDALARALMAVGIDVYQIDHEDANGQFEINYTYADALTSADRMVLFRMAAGEIAAEHGMICSFMPKPLSNRTGSGMHMHISLGSDGRNDFVGADDPRGLGLSPLAYHFLAGLLAHAPALAALCAPTVNSYKRLVVGRSLSGATWAPAYISYGDNNRTLDGPHRARPRRAADGRLGLQSLPGNGRRHRRWHGRHRAATRPRSAAQFQSLHTHARRVAGRRHRRAAAVAARSYRGPGGGRAVWPAAGDAVHERVLPAQADGMDRIPAARFRLGSSAIPGVFLKQFEVCAELLDC